MTRLRRWLAGIGGLLILYIAARIAMQAGAKALGQFSLAVFGVALVVALLIGAVRWRVVSILVAAVIPLALWLGVFGSYSITRDLLGGALGLALAWPIARLWTGWRQDFDESRPRRRMLQRYLVTSALLVWIINSGLDVAFESEALPRRESPLSAARAAGAPWPEARVGIALSGGGYRAALMHAGVLAELDAMRVPLTAVSSVSGGSIIGSYYATGGSPAGFRDAVVDGRLNLKRDLADIHNALRLPFPFKPPYVGVELTPGYRFGRVDVQANLIDRVLLDGTRLRDLDDAASPRLQICTTDLRAGVGVGLAHDGAAMRSPARPAAERSAGRLPYEVERSFHPAIAAETRLADLVAASGAFPGAFSAVELALPATDDRAERELLLADGGIVDNWGVGLLLDRAASDPDWAIDLLIVSAGGRVFESSDLVPAPEEPRRAIDIIYETAGWRPVELVDATTRPPILLLQPADLAEKSREYQAFANATTLDDRFSAEQAAQIFELGRQLVRRQADEIRALLGLR